MITRRDFLKVTGAAAAAAALTACGGSSSTASSAASGTASSAASSAVAKLDKVKVAVPNDTTNEARALTLLEKNGFFKLKADAGLTATAKDIEENPLNVSVDEVEAAQVPNVLQLLTPPHAPPFPQTLQTLHALHKTSPLFAKPLPRLYRTMVETGAKPRYN